MKMHFCKIQAVLEALCLVACTWNRRTTISRERHYKHFMGSLLPKETKSSGNVASERRKGMQTTCESHSAKVTKRRLINVFRNVTPVLFNNKLSGTLNAMTGNIASFYISKFHTPSNFTISWICVFSTFLFCIILINVFTFPLEIIQILAI